MTASRQRLLSGDMSPNGIREARIAAREARKADQRVHVEMEVPGAFFPCDAWTSLVVAADKHP